MTKICLYAIDNQTPFTFFVRNQYYFNDSSDKSDKVIYYVTAYPGRTWITKDGKSDGVHSSWQLKKFDKDNPTDTGIYFFSQGQSDSAFYLSLSDNQHLCKYTKSTSKLSVVCTIPSGSVESYQLTIKGDSLTSLIFSMGCNIFPTWIPASSGIAGVLNNSPYTMVVRTVRASLEDKGAVDS